MKERSFDCVLEAEVGDVGERGRTGLPSEVGVPAVGVDGLLRDEEEMRLAVCRRVTTLDTGVVNNFAQAPAAAPTASSSRTLR